MTTNFDFNTEFGIPKELFCKDFSKINIKVHPDFFGIYLSYKEVLKALKTNLSMFSSPPEIHVWKDPSIEGYTVVNDFHWYLYYLKILPKNIKILVYSFPQSFEQIKLLKKVVSTEFLNLLCSFNYDIDELNPEKSQSLINTHISAEAIFILNKQYSHKPHRQLSLDLFAMLLSTNRNKLNNRIKIIKQQRRNVFDQLEQNSEIVQQLLNNSDFILSPDQLWKS